MSSSKDKTVFVCKKLVSYVGNVQGTISMDSVKIKQKFDFLTAFIYSTLDMNGDIFVGMMTGEEIEIIEHTVLFKS